MSSNPSNAEILNNLLEGRDLDEFTSRSLMRRWLNDEISDVETGAFLSALRAKSSTGVELSSMARTFKCLRITSRKAKFAFGRYLWNWRRWR